MGARVSRWAERTNCHGIPDAAAAPTAALRAAWLALVLAFAAVAFAQSAGPLPLRPLTLSLPPLRPPLSLFSPAQLLLRGAPLPDPAVLQTRPAPAHAPSHHLPPQPVSPTTGRVTWAGQRVRISGSTGAERRSWDSLRRAIRFCKTSSSPPTPTSNRSSLVTKSRAFMFALK